MLQKPILQMLLFVSFLTVLLVFPSMFVYAQTDSSEPPQEGSEPSSIAQLQQNLEMQLQDLLNQIDAYEAQIAAIQKEGKSLSGEIQILDNNINKIRLQIRATEVAIKELKARIDDTTEAIEATKKNLQTSQEILAVSLRSMDFAERKTLLEILLENKQLSDFFSQIVYLNNLQENIQKEIANLRNLKTTLQKQQDRLEAEQEEQRELLLVQQYKNRELASARLKKQNLLDETKGREANYQKLLVATQKSASEIRAQIYRLAGGGGEITFGEALKYAELAAGATGIRPAFLLAVLTQESDLGKNVGRCYLKDERTGGGVNALSGAAIRSVMHPTRDVPPFLAITKELGRDPFSTPVSCPQPSVGGYGGAMGPAQFIPSTWMIYRDRVSEIVGSSADPWNIAHAFVASAVYLSKLGANAKTYSAERTAALKYFAGANWQKSWVRFYGDSVMAIATRYQEDIDALKKAEIPYGVIALTPPILGF